MLLFATPGAPMSTPGGGGTLAGLKHARGLGIRAMELEWVQRVPLNVEHMKAIRSTAESLEMSLTVHAPYYINLNGDDPAKLTASKKRILDALSMAQIAGAVSVCVHAAFYLGKPPEQAMSKVMKAVESIMVHKKKLFPDVNLALETMGKHSQFGTLEEVLEVSKEFDLYPCVDAAHLHARANGAINSIPEWNEMFDLYARELGKKSLHRMHLHYSGINYTDKGERNHLPLEKSDAKWKDFLKILKMRDIGGICVCESPLMEQDTLLLQNGYAKL